MSTGSRLRLPQSNCRVCRAIAASRADNQASMDRLTSLEVFSRVVETGGFSAAGRKLNMSTTMVSNHVQALEDRLGVRLLHRTTRKVNLTEIGKAYYDRCVQILADLEQADDIASELQ